jgi:hypothetical protein
MSDDWLRAAENAAIRGDYPAASACAAIAEAQYAREARDISEAIAVHQGAIDDPDAVAAGKRAAAWMARGSQNGHAQPALAPAAT